MPDPGDDGPQLSLEAEGGLGWDQFAVNQQKFGVTSTFDEAIYTTTIDRKNCAITEQDAARLAREIEQGNMGVTGLAAYHLAEERGMEINDDVSGSLAATCQLWHTGTAARDWCPQQPLRPCACRCDCRT